MKLFVAFCIFIFSASSYAEKCECNEEYSECGAHGCQNTCEEPALIIYCDPAPGCYPGCVCMEGYLKDSKGNCVEVSACPSVKPVCSKAFEEYTDCGTACPTTCENKDDFTRICTANCVRGCFCQQGYVRDASGDCILPTNCPAPEPIKCLANEQYSECGANGCQNTCENPTLDQVCRGVCIAGCICKEGFLRDSEGKCVAQEECQKPIPICNKNEEFTDCGTACPLTCENKDQPPLICTLQCVAGCFCLSGFVRDCEGNCVLPSDCSYHKIPEICLLPMMPGPCKAAFPRWAYSSTAGKCIKFIYGGCEGNENNFSSEKECKNVCMKK